MHLGINGKVALIAAASRGLGRAVADELAAEGAKLVLCARGVERLNKARDEIIHSTGGSVLAVPADISAPVDVARVVQAGLEQFGQIDILITNTGGPPAGKFESLDQQQWETATRLTLYSALELTRLVLPGMKQRRWGRILNITSIAVKQPVENLILSNSLRAAEGITAPEFLAKWVREIPMGRLGDPREFAALAAFLVSERASYITGASVSVDGGWIRSLL